jgi:mono/diheme cytochrome c family protein
MRLNMAVATVLLVLCGGSWVLAEGPVTGNPKRGQMIYEQLCQRCHGEKLDGKGQEAKWLRTPPADLQSLSSMVKSDWELLIIMSHGVSFTPMHGFRDVLNEQEMRDLLSFIRLRAPFAPIS